MGIMIDTQAFHRSNPRLQQAFNYCAIRSLELDLDIVKRLSVKHFIWRGGKSSRRGVGEGFSYGTLLCIPISPQSPRSKQKAPSSRQSKQKAPDDESKEG